MSIRVDDPTLGAAFAAKQSPVEVIGPDGTVLGAFIPGPVDPFLIKQGVSRGDMMRRAAASGPGYTGEQVIAYLRCLKC